MTSILTEIIQLLTGGLTEMATAIGSGLNGLVQKIFISASGTLSTFGGLIIIFAGIALAVGLSRWVVNFLTSLGN